LRISNIGNQPSPHKTLQITLFKSEVAGPEAGFPFFLLWKCRRVVIYVKKRTMLHYALFLSLPEGWDGNIVYSGAFVRFRSDPSLCEIWGRGVVGLGKPSSRLALGLGLVGAWQFGNPQQLRVHREQLASWSCQSGGPRN
jgi:hypothetical protein